jgi:type VII secretion protein EccB
MQTRREQVRAYRFINRRIMSALLSGDPESTELPMRRLGLAIFGSTMLAAIIFAAVGVYALYNPGGGQLETDTLVIERETGARYVYMGGRLHPLLNFTSGRLILGQAEPRQATMSRNSLLSVPRGRTLGIEGVPDALPAPSALLGLPWSVCSTAASGGRPTTHLAVGRRFAGGVSVDDVSMLVESGGTQYLIWRHHRLRLQDSGVRAALEISSARPMAVGDAVLNAITAGPDLKPPQIRDKGKDSGLKIDGKPANVGDVFRSGNEHYVLLTDGLVPISVVTARLLNASGGNVRGVTANEAGKLRSQTRIEPEGSLSALPRLRELDPTRAAVCAVYHGEGDADNATTVESFDRAPSDLTQSTPDAAGLVLRGTRSVDRVVVDGGHGALVQTLPVSGGTAVGTTVYLMTDDGVKYALIAGKVDAKAALGYGNVTPVLVPASLVALVPSGPPLSMEAALTFAGESVAPD